MGWGTALRRRSGDLLQFRDNTPDRNRHYCVMKLKTAGIILVWLASVGCACASTNDITTLVQKGLFEEEANHHLDAAMEYYQEAIGNFDKDRQLAATAIFIWANAIVCKARPMKPMSNTSASSTSFRISPSWWN